MRGTLLSSLLELAHATSQNLGFAHRDDVFVSYGEETITETNLLELRRRHPGMVHLRTFGKKTEALNGADWEWHVIGRGRKLRMRVQAKRLQKDNKLKIPHEVASSGNQQIELLIKNAKALRMKPVYCFYASEAQRTIWRKASLPPRVEEFEYGCLLASAHEVRAKGPTTLAAIERSCVPWHYLIERRRFAMPRIIAEDYSGTAVSFMSSVASRLFTKSGDDTGKSINDFPTIDQLNAKKKPRMALEGVVEAGSPDYERGTPDEAYRERGISRLLELVV